MDSDSLEGRADEKGNGGSPAGGRTATGKPFLRMRVLHVITALGVGGAERMLLKLVGAGPLAHCEHHVVSMLPADAMTEPLRASGARVSQLNFLGGIPLVSASLRLALLARAIRPDLVHGWLYHGNLGAALARAVLPQRVPMVWGIRQSLPTLQGENVFARIGIALNRLGSAMPDRILFNSLVSLDQHRKSGFRMDRGEYLPNGFETESFRPQVREREHWRSQWGLDEAAVVFGVLARYHPTKDHAGFLQAARIAVHERPAARFVLAGAGVREGNEALMREVRRAGLDGRILLLGEQHGVAGLLSALDVYVSSSAAEAFSNSIGEAMSCALPCVVTDVGDSRFIVGQTGDVVPPRDPASLAAAMVRMVDLGSQGRAALGAQARHRILEDFSIESVASRYASLYETLVRPARGGA